MGKKVLVSFTFRDYKGERGFGNQQYVREHPNCPLSITEIREIEDKILLDLLKRGVETNSVLVLNIIPLGD